MVSFVLVKRMELKKIEEGDLVKHWCSAVHDVLKDVQVDDKVPDLECGKKT